MDTGKDFLWIPKYGSAEANILGLVYSWRLESSEVSYRRTYLAGICILEVESSVIHAIRCAFLSIFKWTVDYKWFFELRVICAEKSLVIIWRVWTSAIQATTVTLITHLTVYIPETRIPRMNYNSVTKSSREEIDLARTCDVSYIRRTEPASRQNYN